MRGITFRQWLAGQIRVDDRVGDLATDMEDDEDAPNFKTHEELVGYLKHKNACDGAVESAKEAWRRYEMAAAYRDKADPGLFTFNAHTSPMFTKRTSPCVYFIREADGGPIKIGMTNADGLERRLCSLQIGNPRQLKLVGLVCISGSSRSVAIREEGRLHKHFRGFHVRGEWFEPCDRLLDLVREHSMDGYGGKVRYILKAALERVADTGT